MNRNSNYADCQNSSDRIKSPRWIMPDAGSVCRTIAFFMFLIFVYIALYLLKSPYTRCILLIYSTVCMEFTEEKRMQESCNKS